MSQPMLHLLNTTNLLLSEEEAMKDSMMPPKTYTASEVKAGFISLADYHEPAHFG